MAAPPLNLMHWNTNGMWIKLYELEQIIEAYGMDILLVNETGLKPQHRLHIHNYENYRNDRIGAPKGVTAIIIKITIQHHRITLPPLDHIEATAISVQTGRTDIIFIAAYKPPPNPIINKDLDKLFDHQPHFLLAGDLYSKHTDWNCRQKKKAGKDL
ncbi:hypothetical protein PR048_021820 [Dryococelus australis]|uniref:Endonuclease/exonuclease/phosphatase domain-containing protein n=1 Tax=Dryococelus australis TaxID=614101 RepID=A0ABQ9GZ91_9NEOP|nr:hypothetical protein PR048_021820 [Dryococelus australis]